MYRQALVGGSREDLFVVSPAGRVLSWSRAAEMAFGYGRDEAVGRLLAVLAVDPAGVRDVQDAIRTALAGEPAECVSVRRRKDGTLLDPMPMVVTRRQEGDDVALVFHVGREGLSPDRAPPPASPARLSELPRGLLVRAPHPGDAAGTLQAEVNRLLRSTFEPGVMLAELTRLLVPRLADWAVVDLVEPGGALRRLAPAHRDPALAAHVQRLAHAPVDAGLPANPHPVVRHAESRAATVDLPAPRPDEPAHLADLRAAGVSSYLCVPLLARMRALGVLTLVRVEEPPFSDEEAAWAEDLARRAALEVENARLNDAVQRSRHDVRRATERARLLERMATCLAHATTPMEVADGARELAGEAMGAHGVAVALTSEAAGKCEVAASSGEADPLFHAWRTFPLHARLPLADAARSGEPVLVESYASSLARYPHLGLKGGLEARGALAAFPLHVKDRAAGAIGFTFHDARAMDADDLSFLRALAQHAAGALERARLYATERHARGAADEDARQAAFLADASRVLATSFDTRATLPAVARLIVHGFADVCAVFIQDGGRLQPVALATADVTRENALRELAARPQVPFPGLHRALERGHPELYLDLPDHALLGATEREEDAALLRRLRLRSLMSVPLVARGRALGVLMLARTDARRYGTRDLHHMEELARRIALAYDNARLFRHAQESEERLRLLVEGVRDHAFLLLDAQGRVAAWNAGAERLFGHPADAVVGVSHAMFYAPDELVSGLADDDLRQAERSGRYERESWRVRADGSRFLAHLMLTALRHPDGSLRGYSQVVRDLTEHRQAAEEIERTRRQVVATEKLATMGSLVSGVAHEIRTPLTAIANSVHLMGFRLDRAAKGGPGEEMATALRPHIGLALESVDRINALVQDLRRFTKVRVGERERVGLHAVVQDAVSLFRAAHQGRILVLADLRPTRPCDLDRLQVQQVVLNLLQNAAEAMPYGGKVRVETREEDGRGVLVVEDEGAGMSPDVQARMFEEFFTTKPEGTGLGLSIVRRIVETHGGSIDCRTEPGRGTRFEIRLPHLP